MASSGIPPDNKDKNLLDPADGIDAQNTSSDETPGDALIPSPEIFAGEHEQANEIQLDEIDGLDNTDYLTDTLEFETVRRRPSRGIFGVKLAIVLMIFSGVGYLVWTQWGDFLYWSSGNDFPIVRAPDEPFKVRPVKPGGANFPNRDKLVYDRLERSPPQRKSENLLPRPELPLMPSTSKLVENNELNINSNDQNSPPKTMGAQPATEEVKAVIKPQINSDASDNQSQDSKSMLKKVPDDGRKSVSKPVDLSRTKNIDKNKVFKSFQVQLAAVRSASAAKKEWQRLRTQNMSLLSNLKLKVARVDLGNQGIFFRLRAGPIKTRLLAKDLCRSLSKKKVGCLVIVP